MFTGKATRLSNTLANLDNLEITLPTQWEEWLMRQQRPAGCSQPAPEPVYIGLRLQCQSCDFSAAPTVEIDTCPVCAAASELFRYTIAVCIRHQEREKTDIDRAYQMAEQAHSLLETATLLLGNDSRKVAAAAALERTENLVQSLDEIMLGEEAIDKIREFEDSFPFDS